MTIACVQSQRLFADSRLHSVFAIRRTSQPELQSCIDPPVGPGLATWAQGRPVRCVYYLRPVEDCEWGLKGG